MEKKTTLTEAKEEVWKRTLELLACHNSGKDTTDALCYLDDAVEVAQELLWNEEMHDAVVGTIMFAMTIKRTFQLADFDGNLRGNNIDYDLFGREVETNLRAWKEELNFVEVNQHQIIHRLAKWLEDHSLTITVDKVDETA